MHRPSCCVLAFSLFLNIPPFEGALAKQTNWSRAKFEKILLEKAKPESLQTETAGAWDEIYQHILVARTLDGALYERALLGIQLPREGCGAKPLRSARLACEASDVADAASSMTNFAAAVELRRDAVAYAEEGVATDPATLFKVLLALAGDEMSHGGFSEAEKALTRAAAIAGSHPELLTDPIKVRMAALNARIADARLDTEEAVKALGEATALTIASKEKLDGSGVGDDIDPSPVEAIVNLHLRGRFCTECGESVRKPIRAWLDAVLTGRADEDTGTEFPQYQHLLAALSAPAGMFAPEKLASYSRRFLKLAAAQEIHPDAYPKGQSKDDAQLAHQFALANLITGSTSTSDASFGNSLKALRIRNVREQAKLLHEILNEVVIGQYEQFGGDKDISSTLDSVARYLQAFGYRSQARATLQFLMNRETATGAKAFESEQKKLAGIYAPALARLASLDHVAGDEKSALRNLDKASALAATKLRDEWTYGGSGAILALRDLAPALRLIAQKRSEIATARGLSRNGTGHDALFRALQAAMFGETALTLAVADQRRFLSDEPLRDLRQRYLQAVATADRAAEIAGYNFTSGDVDGALARTRKEAEQRRDALGREFSAKVPTAFALASDIEPAPLAEVSTRLGEGEALTLLHVGSHGIHGFLLDKSGQSLAWKTTIKREHVEALVKSLRASGDVSRGPFPAFPYADAAKLHEVLFGPVSEQLGRYEKLVVVGDGPLQAMPYGLLLTKSVETPPATPEQMRAANLPWLIRSHTIALMPSVRSLVAQRDGTQASRAGKPFLGVGDPKLADAGGALRNIDIAGAFGNSSSGLADVSMLRRLVSLPETADELRTIAKLLEAPEDSLLLGNRASEKAIRSMNLSDYKVIAFATHGVLAGQVTGTREPGLVLSPPETASREDDGFLALSEIADLRFDADLVMLSACNTGASDGRPRAEGLSGLARGFFGAGARSLLVTHWEIPSDSSVEITTGLIAHRKAHPEADWAEAHRAATLSVIDTKGPAEWTHPAYWGGFAVVGVMPIGEGRNYGSSDRD